MNTGKTIWYYITRAGLYFKLNPGRDSIFVVRRKYLKFPIKRGKLRTALKKKSTLFAYNTEMISWEFRELVIKEKDWLTLVTETKRLLTDYEFEGDEKIMVF